MLQNEIFELYCFPRCPNNIQAYYIRLSSSTLTHVPKTLVQEIIPFPIQESTLADARFEAHTLISGKSQGR